MIQKEDSRANIKNNGSQAVLQMQFDPAYRPSAVYRIQLNKDFNFDHALRILPYIGGLGIDAVYLSPIYQAVPGSAHGYNVTDPNRINEELGGEEAFGRFSDALKNNNLGLLLDFVPNHMGIEGGANPFWQDVLENGPASQYAHFFDIDWDPVKEELKDKVFLPVLGRQYGQALEHQELRIAYAEGAFEARYFDKSYPIAPDTYPCILEHGIADALDAETLALPDWLEYRSIAAAFRNLPARAQQKPELVEERSREKEVAKGRLRRLTASSAEVRGFVEKRVQILNGVLGETASFDLLDDLLSRQSYRLAYWRVGSEEINYRRFFDINDLAAIRMEDPRVFEHFHRLVFRLLAEGRLQGLRIDHPDGLYDPTEYFRRLQERAAEIAAQTAEAGAKADAEARPLFLVVEKILDHREELPADWLVHGTVGYEFLISLTGLFVMADREKDLTEIYERFTGETKRFEELVYEKKKFFAAFCMPSELSTLAHRLDKISEKVRTCRDFTLSSLTTAIREVIACFPVYRTYLQPEGSHASERDAKWIRHACARARRKHPALDRTLFDFLEKVLLGELGEGFTDADRSLLREFVFRFQQLSAPIMAKGMEDTAFYVYNRLISLNEVGGDPTRFGWSPEAFHAQAVRRLEKWPYGLLASSTHDTKRSDDVRMRLNALSEMPSEWAERVEEWSRSLSHHRTQVNGAHYPEKNTEYLIFQTLVGVWPNEPADDAVLETLTERMWNYLLKSAREAKTYTNWLNPNAEYEDALQKYITAALAKKESGGFFENFEPFQRRVARLGALNSLSAVAIKLASPGVADCYQGSAIWDYSLVDPDNRRQVDYGLRQELLETLLASERGEADRPAFIKEILTSWQDGRVKLYVTQKALRHRARHKELFLTGHYVPLEPAGEQAARVTAFARELNGDAVVVIAGRFFAEFGGADSVTLDPSVWKDTEIPLPGGALARVELWEDIFSGRTVTARERDGRRYLLAREAMQSMNLVWLVPASRQPGGKHE